MIVEGKAVGSPSWLAYHLTKTENEQVKILEITGTASNDNLRHALDDMHALGALTKTQNGKVLYHANLDPKKNEKLTPEQYLKAADIVMEKLGFQGQPRAVVMHVKGGRQHAHLVVQLTDIEKGRLLPTWQNYKKHQEAAKQIERELELEKIKREKTGRSYNKKEAEQAKKSGLSVDELRELIKEAFEQSRSAVEFQKILKQKGLILAKDKRLIVIDRNTKHWSLTRQLKAVAKAKEVKEKVASIEKFLPSLEHGKGLARRLDKIKSPKSIDQSQEEVNFRKRVFKNKTQFTENSIEIIQTREQKRAALVEKVRREMEQNRRDIERGRER